MPTKAFFNLPISKQETICTAAIQEFSENLLADASINKIIKAIDMPRGSFYLYFENKEDLYFYIISIYHNRLIEIFKKSLQKNKGDLIDGFIELFDFITKKVDTKNLKNLIKNICLNMNSKQLNQVFMKEENEAPLKEIYEFINKKNLRVKKEEDLIIILRILMTLLAQALGESFMKNIDKKDTKKIRDTYIKELHMIKIGLYN